MFSGSQEKEKQKNQTLTDTGGADFFFFDGPKITECNRNELWHQNFVYMRKQSNRFCCTLRNRQFSKISVSTEQA